MLTLTIVSLLVAQALGAYVGPEAKPVVLPSGHLADTHDVAAAKNLHLSALSQASVHSGAGEGDHYDHGEASQQIGYKGPQALPKVDFTKILY